MITDPLFLEMNNFRFCNLRCSYCSPNGEKKFLKSSFDNKLFLKQTKSIIQTIGEKYYFPTLKYSGNGEISLLSNFSQLLSKDRKNIVITNGTGSNKFYSSLLEMKKDGYEIVIQLSLDGHTHQMNCLRFYHNKIIQKKIITNLKCFLENGFSVEVNIVLHRYNVLFLRMFTLWLDSLVKKTKGLIKLIPFPVRAFRNNDIEKFYPELDEMNALIEFLINPQIQYQKILPPQGYLTALANFLLNGKRQYTCSVPDFGLFVDSNFSLQWCACGGKREYGNLLKDGNKALEKRASFKFLGLEKNCAKCFNHYELLNLYLDNKLETEEMIRMPSFELQERYLKIIKETYDKQ